MVHNDYRRCDYPRPQFRRENWINLNGEWEFVFDDDNAGIVNTWYASPASFPMTINVPFVYESALSGINDQKQHDVVWYRKKIDTPTLAEDEMLLLHFGAVDYHAQVFINGQLVAEHYGGETPFCADITPYLHPQEQQNITVRVDDALEDETIPRGKQFWHATSAGIWYTRSTGIWQSVWLEKVKKRHLESAHFQCDINSGFVEIEASSSSALSGDQLIYTVTKENLLVARGSLTWVSSPMRWKIDYVQRHIFRTGVHGEGEYLWSPEHPNLFDVTLELKDATTGEKLDTVHSYFGLRKIEAKDGMIYLNDRPYYQKLVLDQGYWPEGLLTAPTDEDYRRDIELAKAMGFNGCRKHQKLEDPRFLYWADSLGFLVWEEGAAAPVFSASAVRRVSSEWAEIIQRDRSHPSIVVWVPLNESWGVPAIGADEQQRHYSQALYHLIKALDPSRLVESNDGWEQTETDICAIHNYMHGEVGDTAQYAEFKDSIATSDALIRRSMNGRPTFVSGFGYSGQPIVLSECGGIAFADDADGWGYTRVASTAGFLQEYGRLIDAIYSSESLWGFCYTQLTDVEQEKNGLLSYDRQPKCDLAAIRDINERHHPHSITQ